MSFAVTNISAIGAGTVTSVSVTAANGFDGTVLNPTTNAEISIGTYITGILYANGTGVSAATAGEFPVLNQNTTGTAANITATSNSTLTTLTALSLPTTQLTGTLQAAQEPGHTGDVTNTAGSLVLSLVATSNSTLTSLSALTTASLLSSVGTITTGTWTGTTIAINHGGTGQTSALTAFNALSPLTTAGDTLYFNGTNNVRLPIGATNTVLTVVAGEPAWVAGSGGGGITQLTGDVTAGPGSGSVASTVAAIQGTTVSGTTGTTNVVFSASPTLTGTAIATNITMSGTLLTPTVEGLSSAGTLLLQGGTAASSGPGGVVTIDGASGSNVTTGGAGGNININGGAAQGNNTQNNSGGAIALSAGASIGSATGGTVTINSGTGGIGTSTAGATGGTTNVNGGTGGAGSATSGAGGGFTGKAGSGGGGVAGGTGGTAQIVGGTGGTGSASGGNGGPANVQGGSPGSFANSAGGAVGIAAGNGSGTGAGGAGGAVTIATGTAGGDNTQNNNGGSLTLSVGHSMGSANGNIVTITAGTGGIGTSTLGANGGNLALNAGNGGVGSATGGTGGNVVISAGTGGNSGTPGAGGFIQFEPASTTSNAERFRITATECFASNSQLEVKTAGFGLGITHGSNCKLGTSTLSAGTVVVANTSVTAASIIFLTIQTPGGTVGSVYVSAKSTGTSFTISSTSSTDTSTVGWIIIEGL